jgi:hypothetical protein
MNFRENRKIIIAIIAIISCIVIFAITDKVMGAEKTKWRKAFSGEIVDVDPLVSSTQGGLFFEMNGHFLMIWKSDWQGDRWPTRGEIGTFYSTKGADGDADYKWIGSMPKKSVTKKTPKKISSTPTIKSISSWSSIIAGLPPVNKTVLVKYKNGTTITTAYINTKKQWKLETDRNRVAGGREITTIEKWRDIQE